jgi:F420-dependent oxidoreductase-like protein
MRLGVDVSQHQLSRDELVDRTRLAEQLGFEAAWVFDHFKPLYGDPKGPCLEGWTLLAALAAQTDRIRLGTLVTGVTYRHPSVLAAEAVTVDHASAGRLELGMGAAWFDREHHQLGIPFPSNGERAKRLEEAVQVVTLLMTEDNVTFEGRYYRLHDATYRPRPVQKPRPPLWIGARGEKVMLPIVARHADAWHAFGSLESLRRKSSIIDEHATKAGRDPAEITRASGLSISEPWDEVRSTAQSLAEAGFAYLTVSWPSEGRARLEEFAEEVMPALVA